MKKADYTLEDLFQDMGIEVKDEYEQNKLRIRELFVELDEMDQRGKIIQESHDEDLHIFTLLDERGKMPEIPWYMEHGYASVDDYRMGNKNLNPEFIPVLKASWAKRNSETEDTKIVPVFTDTSEDGLESKSFFTSVMDGLALV